jgi:PKD repeat protein
MYKKNIYVGWAITTKNLVNMFNKPWRDMKMRRPIALLIVLLLCISIFSIAMISAVSPVLVTPDVVESESGSRRMYHPLVFEDFVDDGDGAEAGTVVTLTDTDIPYYNDWCKGWSLKFLSGANKDLTRTIGGYNALTYTLNWSFPLPSPVQVGDQYRIWLTDYDMMNIYYMCCQNMTGDVHYMDLVPHISNGDSENIGFPGLNWEDVNLTYTSINRMNFSYPRMGLAAAGKGLYCSYDDTNIPWCNISINGLGLIVGGAPVGGRDKELNCDVWFDTDGDYDIIQDTGTIEGIMGFDFDPDTTPTWNGGTGTWDNVEPHVTKCDRFYNFGQQEEEFADGVGFWKVEPPAGSKDMNSGQFFVTLYRTDQVADDDNNATADLKVYCGFTSKVSVFNLPYKHPLVNPVAVAKAKHAEDTQPPEKYAGFNDTLGQMAIRENEDVIFDGSASYDPQDDTGLNGVAFGDPNWGPPNDPDLGEGDGIIQNGDPEGEPDYGEIDNLQYRWIWGTGRQDSGWLNTPYVTHKFKLPSKVPVLTYEVTLQVRDPEQHVDEDTCYIKVWDDPGSPPFVDVSVAPDENDKDKAATVLVDQSFKVTGFATDPDPEQTLSYYWDLNNYDPDKPCEWIPGFHSEFEDPEDKNGTTEFTMKYSQAGYYRITLNVYDGDRLNETGEPNIDTLNATDYIIVHVIENTEPTGQIKAKLWNTTMTESNSSISVRDNKDIEFRVYASDPDNRPGFDPDQDFVIDYQLQYHWDFGDGDDMDWTTEDIAVHKYLDKGPANTEHQYYIVTVKVRDGPESNPFTAETTLEPFKVYVNLAPIAEAGPNLPNVDYGDEIQAGDIVLFNGSGSYDPNDDLDNSKAIDGDEVDNLKYSWNFGDKTPAGEGKFPEHEFKKDGEYTVQLTVSDTGGRAASDTMIVTVVAENKAPVLVSEIYEKNDETNRMTGNEITVYTSDDMVFNAKNCYDPDGKAYTDDKNSTEPHTDIAFLWDFGMNGSSTSTYQVIYSYEEDGDYEVTLSITDKSHDRKITISEVYTIHVLNRAPFAKINADPDGTAGEAILVNGKDSYDVDGDVEQYSWDWGDELKEPFSNETSGQHTYEKPGVYVVKLWVMDNDGESSEAARFNMTINPPKKEEKGGLIPGFEVVLLIGAIGMLGAVAVLGRKKRR